MNTINLLIQLAETPEYLAPLNKLLTNETDQIQHAFLNHHVEAIKKLFTDEPETIINERTVTLLSE